MRILWMSLRRGNALQEAVEQIHAVVRTRARLGVVLDRASRDVQQLESLDRAVVEVHVRARRGADVGLPADGLVGVDGAGAPRAASSRTIEALIPASSTAIRGPSPVPWCETSDGVTVAARSCPAIWGSASISPRAAPCSTEASKTPPRMAPALRMCCTRAR